jgi:hypothetical protein
MDKDHPDLRAEIRNGWWCLVLGEETIATYVASPAGRAAVEQVIRNWWARRASGETDDEIIAAQGYRPTEPIPGTPKWLEARVVEQERRIAEQAAKADAAMQKRLAAHEDEIARREAERITAQETKAAKDAEAAAEGAALTRQKLAAIEKRLADNPPDRPGWGSSPLPSNMAGNVAAEMRRHYNRATPRKEFEHRWYVSDTSEGEREFMVPENRDLGNISATTIKNALALARR